MALVQEAAAVQSTALALACRRSPDEEEDCDDHETHTPPTSRDACTGSLAAAAMVSSADFLSFHDLPTSASSSSSTMRLPSSVDCMVVSIGQSSARVLPTARRGADGTQRRAPAESAPRERSATRSYSIFARQEE